jgi:predicted metal-dependent hydrolase
MKMLQEYKLVKRKVKHIRLEIKDGFLQIVIPYQTQIKPEQIVNYYKEWLNKKFNLINEAKNLAKNCKLYQRNNFEKIILTYIDEIGKILNKKPKIISFRLMKRRWGSCLNNKIIFNKLLSYLPHDLIKYVVVHEMCHLIIKNHKKEFWLLVKKFIPDFYQKEKLLTAYKIYLFDHLKIRA